MKVVFWTWIACQTMTSAIAADHSYVVLNMGSENSLVRVAADGRCLGTIASGAGGYGLAKDSAGNYIVAAVGSLLRVSPSGTVATIATAPAGSGWISVVEASTGDFIVVDNRQHSLWQVSPNGQSIRRLANYAPPSDLWNGTAITTDGKGDYLLIEDIGSVHFDRITPTGDITTIQLHGELQFFGGLSPDGPNAYLSAGGKGESIIRLTTRGDVTELARFNPPHENVTGVVRDPETGEFLSVVNMEHSLLRTTADGRTTVTLSTDQTCLGYPDAILVEGNR